MLNFCKPYESIFRIKKSFLIILSFFMRLFFSNSITKNEKPYFLIPCLVGRCLITPPHPTHTHTTPTHTPQKPQPSHLPTLTPSQLFPLSHSPTQSKQPHKGNLTPSTPHNRTKTKKHNKKIFFYFLKTFLFFFIFSFPFCLLLC